MKGTPKHIHELYKQEALEKARLKRMERYNREKAKWPTMLEWFYSTPIGKARKK